MSTLPPEPVDVPAALREPVLNPPARWVAFLTLASIGLWAGFFGPIQVLLAQQAEAIDPANKKEILSLVLGLGALTSVDLQPGVRRVLRPDHAADGPPAARGSSAARSAARSRWWCSRSRTTWS